MRPLDVRPRALLARELAAREPLPRRICAFCRRPRQGESFSREAPPHAARWDASAARERGLQGDRYRQNVLTTRHQRPRKSRRCARVCCGLVQPRAIRSAQCILHRRSARHHPVSSVMPMSAQIWESATSFEFPRRRLPLLGQAFSTTRSSPLGAKTLLPARVLLRLDLRQIRDLVLTMSLYSPSRSRPWLSGPRRRRHRD